jgi:hypothetical protein
MKMMKITSQLLILVKEKIIYMKMNYQMIQKKEEVKMVHYKKVLKKVRI